MPLISSAHSLIALLAWILYISLTQTSKATDTNADPRQPPNFVIFLGDNLSYADIGHLANKSNNVNPSSSTSRTPHIDKLAREGLHLEHWNSVAHLCSASRSSLLTGRYPIRDGVYPGVFHNNAALGLSPTTPTMASLLREKGYATSIVGKWHLGHRPEYLPTRFGFDEWFGIPYHMSGGSLDGHICARDPDERQWLPLYHNETIVQQPVQLATLADRYARQATDFIHRNAEKQQPFFLYLPFSHVHQLCAPRDLPEQEYCQWTADPTRLQFGDAVAEMDWIVGEVMDAVRSSGVASQTLVLFTADNGPWVAEQSCSGKKGKFVGQWLMEHVDETCTACPHDYVPSPTTTEPHRCILPVNHALTLQGVPCGHDSGLGSLWEANVRTPAFAWWPGRISPGRVTQKTVATLDVLPTVLSLVKPTETNRSAMKNDWILDGIDISHILLGEAEENGEQQEKERILFFWRDGFDEGPLPPPYGRMDVAALKVGFLKVWFWTKSGHYNDDPHQWHDPPLVFNIDEDPAESRPLNASKAFFDFVQELRLDHMKLVSRGPPLTLAKDDSYIPCADSANQCRTGHDTIADSR